jgi:hypothetical protein
MTQHHNTTHYGVRKDCAIAVLSRREVVSVAPFAGVAMALPASAGEADPVMPIYRKWCAARAEWDRLSKLPGGENSDTPEMLAVSDVEFSAVDALGEVAPTTWEGAAALLHVFWEYKGPCSLSEAGDAYEEEVNRYDRKLIQALWRGASGKSGLPRTV